MNSSINASVAMLAKQRSHVLLVLSQPHVGQEAVFRQWYGGTYRRLMSETEALLSAQYYEQHETDITQGRWPRLPFRYLALYEVSVDGASAAAGLINRVRETHLAESTAAEPATWLYYPACEKVGRPPQARPSMLTIAFANGVVGQDEEFREWYATRHIRHAMNVPALVSGQCFERTSFQKPGALEAKFKTIAIYEQEGSPESILQSFAAIPPGTLEFPALDVDPARFSESVYRPI